MAHFAELGEDNIVLRVIVVHDNECKEPFLFLSIKLCLDEHVGFLYGHCF